MAKNETKYYHAHKNIYIKSDGDNYSNRNIRVEIGLPEQGTNEDTGMLVFVPAYGGNIDSNVYKRMRAEFSDKYNLITIQCDYFGNKFMDSNIPEELSAFINSPSIEACRILYNKVTDETENEFNDMGIMQALDIVSTTVCCINDLAKRGYVFNTNKTILFGTSHGSYLSHLANAICPNLFTCILDISAYMTPYYLNNVRILSVQRDKRIAQIKVHQFLNTNIKYRYKEVLYDLRELYKSIDNNCIVLAFQGKDDWMVSTDEKAAFIENLPNAQLILIGKEDADGITFKNSDHGLGLDFFKFFEMIMPMLDGMFADRAYCLNLPKEVLLGTDDAKIHITYERGLPELMEISFPE